MSAIETRSGRLFSLVDPRPEDVDIKDIAHALSQLCRFTGHTRMFYSVAQHCIHVSYLVPDELALQGLLHDASEAYIGDLSSPLKAVVDSLAGGRLRRLEDEILEAIAERFGVPFPFDPRVKEADLISMMTEVRDFMPGTPSYWAGVPVLPHPGFLASWSPHMVRDQYLRRFKELTT